MHKKVRLKGGRELIGSIRKSRLKGHDRWLVYLPESGSDFLHASTRELNALVGPKWAKEFHFLSVNKPGQYPSFTDREEFEAAFKHQYRVQDYTHAVKTLIPPEAEIWLIGYSEGAYLAPQVASKDRRVKAVIMIGGGTRGWLKEELANARGRERKAVLKKIREIHSHPRKMDKWNGFPYATWYSYRHDDTLSALKKIKVPVLGILGAKDRTIDLKAALNDLRRLKRRRRVEIELYKSCGHSFKGHWPRVRQSLKKFLTQSL